MKTGTILEEHFVNFAELDPYGYLERAYLPDRVCLGTVIEQGEGADIPAALMILRMMDEKVIVEWICVRDELRQKGLGSDLMSYAFKSALSAGCDKLYIMRGKNPGRDQLCPFEEDFLEEYGFKDEEPFSREWSCSVNDLLKNSNMAAAAKEYNDTKSLKKLSEDEMDRLREFIASMDRSHFLYDPALVLELADPKVSRVLLTDGDIKGAIFLQKCGDDLYVTGLCSNDKKEDMNLCLGATMAASKKYGMELKVNILKNNDTDIDIVEDLMKTEALQTYICSASVEDYYDVIDDFEPVKGIERISCGLISKVE